MRVRPAGREACNCASPYNSILERLDAMEAEILAVQATANSAMGVANAQAGAAASSASAAAASATAAGNAAISAASDASDALTQATAAAGSADDAADSAADALTALQNIEGTIASVLASDIGGKVDKLTTAGFYLYMHNGSTQGEVQPVVAPTAATIPIRDSNGRMQAADPASGATDKTLVTANWVSQTGDSAPNNLMHRTGNERKTGVLTTSTPYLFKSGFVPSASTNTRTNYHRVLSFTRSSVNNTKFEMTIIGGLNNTRTAIAKVLLSFGSNANDVQIAPIVAVASSVNWSVNIKVIRTSDSVDIWIREAQYVQYCAYCTVKYGQYVDVNSAITGLAVGDMATSSDPSNEPDTVATITVSTYTTYPIEV